MDTCIVIRSAFVKNQKAIVQAGAGVVFDSNTEAEVNETEQKASAVIAAHCPCESAAGGNVMSGHIIFIDNVDSFTYTSSTSFKQLGYSLDIYRNTVSAATVIQRL